MATTKVTTGGITDATIATADIADDAVTNAKIAAGAVGGTQLGNNAVTADKIGANEVTSAAIAAGAVGTAKLSDQCVTLDKLPHGTGSTDGKFLRANNGGDPTFESLPASGATLSGSTNNTVVTVTGSNAMQGEAALTFDGNNFAFSRQDAGDARAYIYGGEGGDARLLLASDEGDDHIDTWEIRAQASDNNLSIYQFGGGSYNKRLSIDTDANNGDVKVHTGNLVIGTSGKGIDFSATGGPTNGTGSSELLDDYEEGAWTITVQVDSYNFNGTYSQQAGRYVKIGSMVHCVGYLQLTNKGNDNGTVAVKGLPFTTSSGGNGTRGSGVVGYYQGVNSSTDQPMNILVEQNDTKITMRHSQSTGSGSLAASDISNSFGMFFNVTYFV